MQSIIFRTFKTYKHYYVYDRHTNSVIEIPYDEYLELQKVETGSLPSTESSTIAKYQIQGLFQPNVVKEIHHPQTDILEHNSQKRLKQLILQVTQQCNLRCEYCAYSGIYDGNRTHTAGKQMDFETAKKAIDFFFAHSTESANVAIGFYGGEPLLEFNLIKKCVDYINTINEGKHIMFSMTTNGTLLSGDIAKFVAENKFVLGISLDGSKKEHDVSRKFANGKGSFDIVIQNLKDLAEKYPEYERENVNIFTTVNPYMDLGCVLEYFSTSDIINDHSIMFNTMVPTNLKDDIQYKESYFQVRSYEYIKGLFSMVDKLDQKYVSQLTRSSLDFATRLKKNLYFKSELSSIIHPGGPCQPGILRLFVRYDGNFYPCERVNENLEYYRIGSLDEGFLLDRMKNIMNIGTLTSNECISCWNLRQCMMCANEIEFHGNDEPCKKYKLEICKEKKSTTEFALYEQCVLREFGYNMNPEVM